MACVVLNYPCCESTKRPRPMTAPGIWQLARTAREQLFGRVIVEAIGADELMRRCRRFRVNGVLFAAIWESDGSLTDQAGQPALGLCDYDEACPEQIMISINNGLLEGHPHVAASTAAHEIGHAVFDLPANVHSSRMKTKAAPDRGIRPDSVSSESGTMDWAEFRANEFMGGFMVPPRLLHKRLLAHAGDAGLPLVGRSDHHGVSGLPVVRIVISAVIDLLAEEFGVSPEFIGVRLAKYRLVFNHK